MWMREVVIYPHLNIFCLMFILYKNKQAGWGYTEKSANKRDRLERKTSSKKITKIITLAKQPFTHERTVHTWHCKLVFTKILLPVLLLCVDVVKDCCVQAALES